MGTKLRKIHIWEYTDYGKSAHLKGLFGECFRSPAQGLLPRGCSINIILYCSFWGGLWLCTSISPPTSISPKSCVTFPTAFLFPGHGCSALQTHCSRSTWQVAISLLLTRGLILGLVHSIFWWLSESRFFLPPSPCKAWCFLWYLCNRTAKSPPIKLLLTPSPRYKLSCL